MSEHQVPASLFPPKSADLNLIENVWVLMSREVYAGTKTYSDTRSLLAAVQAAWARVQQDRPLRQKLVGSMAERLRAVVAEKGGLTKF
jgi:hypothetical protein